MPFRLITLILITCMLIFVSVHLLCRRVFVPTLAHPHGRRWGFSWLEFSPLFWSFARCEGFVRSRQMKDGRNYDWGKWGQEQEHWKNIWKKTERSYGRVNKLDWKNLYWDTKSHSLLLPPFHFQGLGVILNALLYSWFLCHWGSEQCMIRCTKWGGGEFVRLEQGNAF